MTSTLDLVIAYVQRTAQNPPEAVTLESRIDEVGLDSLDMLEMMFELEEKHGIVLPYDSPKPESIGQLVDLLEKHKPAAVNA